VFGSKNPNVKRIEVYDVIKTGSETVTVDNLELNDLKPQNARRMEIGDLRTNPSGWFRPRSC